MSTDATLHVDPDRLPDDPAFLKQLVAQLFETLREKDRQQAKLQAHMDLLLRKVFGRSSEKFDPRQATLFDATAEEGAWELATPQPEPALPAVPDKPASQRRGHGRRRAPNTLHREVLTHDLTPAEKQALGGEERLAPLADEVTEQWEWKPSCIFVIEHHQKKYLRRDAVSSESADSASPNSASPSGQLPSSESPIVVAAKPPQAIPGGVAGPGLLAQVVVSKSTDHLPLNRQERIYLRSGWELSRQTMCGWWLACAELFQPLVALMAIEVLASRVVHIDDTRVDIRDARRKLQFQGHFWVRIGDAEHPLVVFDYTPNRSRDGPEQLLAGYRGYVQADAYSGYDGVYLESDGQILEVACWAHARRKFHDARSQDALAQVALARIGQLYKVEKQLRQQCAEEWSELPADERYARVAAGRQAEARPLLESFHAWLEAESPRLLPQSGVRQAMEYCLNHWTAFCRYTDDGRLDIDNNEAEREMRAIAIGRKNWLFCGSERGARAMAIHFSLIASCRRHGREPWAYLRDLLIRLPMLRDQGHLSRQHLSPMLPHLWQPT